MATEDEVLYGGAAGGGKALALDTPLPTPSGWTTMRDVRPGDWLFDECGRPCQVLAVSDVMIDRPCFEVVFDDGSTIIADADHCWLTFDLAERQALARRTEKYRTHRREMRPRRGTGKRPEVAERNRLNRPPTLSPPTGTVRITRELAESTKWHGRTNHSIRVAQSLALPECELPIDPYVLGVWLGDGTSANNGLDTADEPILEEIRRAGYEISTRSGSYAFGILGIHRSLRELGLLGNKHIPTMYLRASEEQRLALLQGLMDTDGTALPSGACEFYSTNRRLAEDMLELIHTLGIKATLREGRARLYGKDCGPKYRIKFTTNRPVFRLSRKLERQVTRERGTQRWHYVVEVRRVQSVPVKCLAVDSSSHLFLAGKAMIPTHNSDALLIFSIMRRTQIPGSKGLILRRTFPELESSLILRSHQLLAGLAHYKAQHHRWEFANGSILQFGYCESDRDVFKYQSSEYEDICFDELTQFSEFQYMYLMSRARTTKPGVKCYIRAATNPGGVGHIWVKKRFVDVAPWGTRYVNPETGRTRLFIPAKAQDNPHLMEADPQYINRLQELPEDQRRALLDGDWDVFSGQYFSEWNREIHVVKPFEIPAYWKRFRSLDYGLDCTACYWWAVSQDKRCFIYRELYESNLNLSQAAKKILEMTPSDEHISYTVASPDLWNRRQDTGIAGVEVMAKAGLHAMVKADDRRVAGWRALKEYLEPYEDNGVKVARLAIFDTCTNLIRTLPALVRDSNDPEDVDDHCEDHGPESIRYGIMSRPPVTIERDEDERRRMRRRRVVAPVVSKVTGY